MSREASWDHPDIAATREIQGDSLTEQRIEELLSDAGEFFEACLWESETARIARDQLAGHDLREDVLRDFGVGYAPVDPDHVLEHLRALGYSTDELVAAGLANRSPRGRAHAHLHSRIVFPVRNRDGQTVGFAGLGTHLGPSWALWVTSPETRLYRRSEAVFGLEHAARQIAASGEVLVRPDCVEVLKAHQEGRRNAVTVHSSEISRDQMLALAEGLEGGVDALELDLPPEIALAPDRDPVEPDAREARSLPEAGEMGPPEPAATHLNLKRLGIVIVTALAAINAWTGAPLLAVWVGSQAQSGRLLSMWGVLTVVAVLAVLELVLLWALSGLSTKYDRLIGRPRTARETSPWRRTMRGDRVQDIRDRYGVSAPEKVVAISVVAGVFAFEIWFFFYAGSPI